MKLREVSHHRVALKSARGDPRGARGTSPPLATRSSLNIYELYLRARTKNAGIAATASRSEHGRSLDSNACARANSVRATARGRRAPCAHPRSPIFSTIARDFTTSERRAAMLVASFID